MVESRLREGCTIHTCTRRLQVAFSRESCDELSLAFRTCWCWGFRGKQIATQYPYNLQKSKQEENDVNVVAMLAGGFWEEVGKAECSMRRWGKSPSDRVCDWSADNSDGRRNVSTEKGRRDRRITPDNPLDFSAQLRRSRSSKIRRRRNWPFTSFHLTLLARCDPLISLRHKYMGSLSYTFLLLSQTCSDRVKHPTVLPVALWTSAITMNTHRAPYALRYAHVEASHTRCIAIQRSTSATTATTFRRGGSPQRTTLAEVAVRERKSYRWMSHSVTSYKITNQDLYPPKNKEKLLSENDRSSPALLTVSLARFCP
jgi:hypothetical protein